MKIKLIEELNAKQRKMFANRSIKNELSENVVNLQKNYDLNRLEISFECKVPHEEINL